jgi:hypothetical protein
MATNAQVKPLGQSLNRFSLEKAADQIAQTGRSLPCEVIAVKGAIVQVAFQITAIAGQPPITLNNVTIPIVGSEYIRIPVQAGMKGMTVAADAYLGGMSGQGGGIATTARPANLTALAFVPLGNVSFFSVDGNVLVLYGPNGVTIQDQSGVSKIMLTPASITFTVAGQTLTMNSSGITLNGIAWGTHFHTGVATGSGDTGPPA